MLETSDASAVEEILRSMTCCSERTRCAWRCRGDDGRETRQFRQVGKLSIDDFSITESPFFRKVIYRSSLTVLTNGTRSAEDDDRVSSVLPSTLRSYRWNQPNAIRIAVV
jgi:hypothetical protein